MAVSGLVQYRSARRGGKGRRHSQVEIRLPPSMQEPLMIKKLAFALAALSMSAAASAQVYGSFGLGLSRWQGNDSACVGALVCDRDDTSYRAALGYRFNSWIAIEGSYIGFGKMKVRQTGVWTSFDAAGPAVAAAFTMPLGSDKLYLRGRLGLVSMQTKVSVTDDVLGTASDVGSSMQPYAGFGIGYRLTPYMTLDGSLDVSRAKYGNTSGSFKANVAAANVGLTFDF
jgi:OmpA-OmpF porin, OOP family